MAEFTTRSVHYRMLMQRIDNEIKKHKDMGHSESADALQVFKMQLERDFRAYGSVFYKEYQNLVESLLSIRDSLEALDSQINKDDARTWKWVLARLYELFDELKLATDDFLVSVDHSDLNEDMCMVNNHTRMAIDYLASSCSAQRDAKSDARLTVRALNRASHHLLKMIVARAGDTLDTEWHDKIYSRIDHKA